MPLPSAFRWSGAHACADDTPAALALSPPDASDAAANPRVDKIPGNLYHMVRVGVAVLRIDFDCLPLIHVSHSNLMLLSRSLRSIERIAIMMPSPEAPALIPGDFVTAANWRRHSTTRSIQRDK